jgi:hypothetical protein
MSDTIQPHTQNYSPEKQTGRTQRRLNRRRTATTAVVLALGFAAASPAAAANEQEDVLGVDAFTGEVVNVEATANPDTEFERMIFDMAADLPLDHTPAIPIGAPAQAHNPSHRSRGH